MIRHSIILLSALWASQSQAVNLPAQQLQPYDCDVCDSLSHETLGTNWALTNTALGHDTLHRQKSKKYTISATLAQLQSGIALHTLAPEAIIRIVPNHPESAAKPEFTLRTEKQGTLSLQDASALFARDEALNNSAFADNTMALLQLKKELGAGTFILQSSAVAGHENDGYTIHVFDQASSAYLSVATDKARYQYGDTLTATISLGDDAIGYPIDIVNANLVTPDGNIRPLTLKRVKKDVYKAQAHLVSGKGYHGENWYIEAQVDSNIGGKTIKRQAHSAFSYTIPSAAVRSIHQIDKNDPFRFSASVDVATGSRYALQVVLFATDKTGNTIPVETVQKGEWLAPGSHGVTFSFTEERANQFHAPYFVGAIQLTDYGQLKPVFEYNQQIAIHQLEQE
ncbi:DUF4785 domain-containing protein [Legionella spiritensis]|uniref:DUF4785 domain-containing protein n=1 Tax=Legionella spiritensis TaxID=452 RepID=A0A0W0Z8T9_LEGSP|nr:DUF4785 domain-containing protein [Legionella spiritensis]KTD65482.1 hypothetical protein Lspi_0556 [Legionella spiritensis]SNV35863.1 Uncharacterised protein [Legionella spiritensis]